MRPRQTSRPVKLPLSDAGIAVRNTWYTPCCACVQQLREIDDDELPGCNAPAHRAVF